VQAKCHLVEKLVSFLQVFGDRAVLRQDKLNPAFQEQKVSIGGATFIQLGQSLGNRLQLLVAFQAAPGKRLAAALVDCIPNCLAQGSLNLDQLRVSGGVGLAERGGSVSGRSSVGTLGKPPRSWRIFWRNSSS